jgi:hypothetical protein
MHYHELSFFSSSGLSRAFGELLACPGVEGCLVDTHALTLRFSAPRGLAAQLLRRLRRGFAPAGVSRAGLHRRPGARSPR